jgi:DNA-binding transcriptional MerR regulator/methylmalonyl-CoA mutase cobalamin-binding subunit
MTNPDKNAQASTEGLYPIRTVSDLTGVNAITLRAWERRYDIFEPIRKASGHRLYTQEHIDLITRVVGLLDRGVRIGQVKAHLDAEGNAPTGGVVAVEDIWKRYLDRMIAAVIQFNEKALESAYGDALSLYPVATVTDKLLMPLMVELGRRWEQGDGSVAEEHFFGFYLRNKLGARYHHRDSPDKGPGLLLACLPGDRHETGLLLFGLAASRAGYVTILLGADMPLEEISAAAHKTGCVAIVLSGMIQPPANLLEQALPALASSTEVPVFIGGKVSVQAHDILKKTGVYPLGTDINSGLQRIQAVLDKS